MAVSKVNYGDDTLMDLTEDTVSPSNLMKGVTAHDSAGNSITGILEATEITTTLSAESTNVQVPGAKCVYDCIQEASEKEIVYVNYISYDWSAEIGNVVYSLDKTFDEIKALYKNNKIIVFVYKGSYYIAQESAFSDDNETEEKIQFFHWNDGNMNCFTLKRIGGIFSSWNCVLTNNLDQSLSAESKDTHVPSSKCVYDAVQAAEAKIPSVPSWAMEPTKPSYTANEVGADSSGTATSEVSSHNTNTSAHNDIRLSLKDLSDRLNALADSDDTTLDQMSEIVTYIKANKSLIDNVTTTKVNVSDIIDNLTTNVSNKPLSAAQGVALKALIDAITIPTTLPANGGNADTVDGYHIRIGTSGAEGYITFVI